MSKQAIDANIKTLNVDSNLPYVLEVNAPGSDHDPVNFAYAGENWQSYDTTHCPMGGVYLQLRLRRE